MELKQEVEREAALVETHVELLKQGRERLRLALAKQTPTANEKQKIMDHLIALVKKSENAVVDAQAAVDKARQQLADLNGNNCICAGFTCFIVNFMIWHE